MTTTDDPAVTPELRVRAALGLAVYQHPRPIVRETHPDPIDYVAPKDN